MEHLELLGNSNTLPLNPSMESSTFQNMEEVGKFPMESKHKVICSGSTISLTGDLNFFRGIVSRHSHNV
jgi:hypothetical protein